MADSLTRSACAHATLAAGARCPGCGKLQTYLAAKGLTGAEIPAEPVIADLPTDVRRAWLDHPVLALLRHRHRLAFFRQLHMLLKAGQGMPAIFADLLRSATAPSERAALQEVKNRIDGGATFAEAARADAIHFDPVAIELFTAAEASGTLVPMLERQMQRMEEAQSLRWKLVLASLYPMYLVGGYVLGGPLLDLPAAVGPNGSIDGLAAAYIQGVVHNSVILVVVGVALMAFPVAVVAAGMAERWEALKRAMPLVGGVVRGLTSARFCEAISAGTHAGLDAQRTLALAARATASRVVVKHLPEARAVIDRGGTLVDAVAALDVLDGPALGQFATAERVGELDRMAGELAREQSASSVRRLAILITVALVLTTALGLMVVVSKIVGSAVGSLNGYMKAIDDLK